MTARGYDLLKSLAAQMRLWGFDVTVRRADMDVELVRVMRGESRDGSTDRINVVVSIDGPKGYITTAWDYPGNPKPGRVLAVATNASGGKWIAFDPWDFAQLESGCKLIGLRGPFPWNDAPPKPAAEQSNLTTDVDLNTAEYKVAISLTATPPMRDSDSMTIEWRENNSPWKTVSGAQ